MDSHSKLTRRSALQLAGLGVGAFSARDGFERQDGERRSKGRYDRLA